MRIRHRGGGRSLQRSDRAEPDRRPAIGEPRPSGIADQKSGQTSGSQIHAHPLGLQRFWRAVRLCSDEIGRYSSRLGRSPSWPEDCRGAAGAGAAPSTFPASAEKILAGVVTGVGLLGSSSDRGRRVSQSTREQSHPWTLFGVVKVLLNGSVVYRHEVRDPAAQHRPAGQRSCHLTMVLRVGQAAWSATKEEVRDERCGRRTVWMSASSRWGERQHLTSD